MSICNNRLIMFFLFFVVATQSGLCNEKLLSADKKTRDYYREAMETNSGAQYIKEVLLPALADNPDNTEVLSSLALLYFMMEDYVSAMTYAEKSLSKKVDERILELCVGIYLGKGDLKKIGDLKPKIKALEKISPDMLRIMLSISAKDKDIDLYLNAIEKLNSENIQGHKVLQDLKATSIILSAGNRGAIDR